MSSFLQNPRRRPRVPLRLPIEIVHASNSWRAETENLGPGGCLVSSPRPLVAGAPLRIVLRCDGIGGALEVAGFVAWALEPCGGIAFTPRQLGLGTRPEAWFKKVLEARPWLTAGIRRAPDRIALDTPLYLLPPPQRIADLAPEEMALLARADNGITVRALLSSARLDEGRAARHLFALFEKNVFTLAMGEAGEKWRWHAVVAGAGRTWSAPNPPGLGAPDERRPRPAMPAPAPRAPVLTRCASGVPHAIVPRPAQAAPPVLVRATAQDVTLLRGATAARRPPEAQARLQQARAAANADRVDQAVVLLRQALALAPRDAEISTLLGQLAFKDRML